MPTATRTGSSNRPTRVAILSFLFNWPSSGGGIIHTVELAHFLSRAGYEVRHFYARFPSWGIGQVEAALPITSQALDFEDDSWSVATIQASYRQAIAAFAPDRVLITDSWNMKPLLAEAVSDYSFYLRLQALECLCPLNNVRLLVEGDGRFHQCPTHQLADPDACQYCLQEHGPSSGDLHRAERTLCQVGTVGYHERLRRVLQQAEAVLVLNPLVEAMIAPFVRQACVVPWGMDASRFPWPWPGKRSELEDERPLVIFQAGVINEFMKGFPILHSACEQLWQHRQDFELVATGSPAGRVDPWTRYTGWVSQEDLPRYYHEADIVVVPTFAQEGLSRTSVEAMAAGKPVVASRIGGVPATVRDGVTGLLCAPGDSHDLAAKLERLLDDADLRRQLGHAGRRRFKEEFTWDAVIDRYYQPLLARK